MENSSQHNLNQLPTGTELGDFRITGVIGEGGFGIVYLALETTLDRTVAVKEYLPAAIAGRTGNLSVQVRSKANNDAFASGLKNFLREARLLARFSHPAVVEVHRVWEQNGTAYMAMRYYAGKTLREWRQTHRDFSEADIREILEPILDALTSLHEQNVIHRDVSPDNILMRDSGAPVLLDLGAARQVIGGMTQALTTVLKPGYAPIEQYVDDGTMDQGPWTDVYGVGAVLYYLLVGAPPPQAIARMINDPLANMASAVKVEVSPALIATVIKALAVKPENRFQSIAELRAGLQWTQIPAPVRSASPPSAARSEPPTTFTPVPIAAAVPNPSPATDAPPPATAITDAEATVLWRAPPLADTPATGNTRNAGDVTHKSADAVPASTVASDAGSGGTTTALGRPPADYKRPSSSSKWIAVAIAAAAALGGGYFALNRGNSPTAPTAIPTEAAPLPSPLPPVASAEKSASPLPPAGPAPSSAVDKSARSGDDKAKAGTDAQDKAAKAKADAEAKEKAAKAKADNDERVAAAKAKAKQDAEDRATAKARADAEERARRLKQEEDERAAQAKARQAAAEKQAKPAPSTSGTRSVEELASLAATAHRNGESLAARKLWTELVNHPNAQPRSKATAYNNMAVSFCQAGDEIGCERMYAAALRADRGYNVDEAERTHPHTRAAYDRAYRAVRGGGTAPSPAPSSGYQ